MLSKIHHWRCWTTRLTVGIPVFNSCLSPKYKYENTKTSDADGFLKWLLYREVFLTGGYRCDGSLFCLANARRCSKYNKIFIIIIGALRLVKRYDWSDESHAGKRLFIPCNVNGLFSVSLSCRKSKMHWKIWNNLREYVRKRGLPIAALTISTARRLSSIYAHVVLWLGCDAGSSFDTRWPIRRQPIVVFNVPAKRVTWKKPFRPFYEQDMFEYIVNGKCCFNSGAVTKHDSPKGTITRSWDATMK